MPPHRFSASAAGCVSEGWNGYGVLQSAGGAAGALDVGFVPGPTAAPLSALKAVYLLGADELPFEQLHPSAYVIYQVHSEPKRCAAPTARLASRSRFAARLTCLSVQGHHGDAGASAADLVLPGAAYPEKSATYGKVSRVSHDSARHNSIPAGG